MHRLRAPARRAGCNVRALLRVLCSLLLGAHSCLGDHPHVVDTVAALLAVLPTAPAANATVISVSPSARLVFAAGDPLLTVLANTSVVLNCNGASLVDKAGGGFPPVPNFLVVQAGADLTLNDCHLELGNLILYPGADGVQTLTSRVAPTAVCQLNRGSVSESNCEFLRWAATQPWLFSSQPSNATFLWVTYAESRAFTTSGPSLVDVALTCSEREVAFLGGGLGGIGGGPAGGSPPASARVTAKSADDIMIALSYARTGHVQIDLLPHHLYNFTAPESFMSVAAGVNVDIYCNNSVLLDCYSCRPSQVAMEPNYVDLADKATLALNDCIMRSVPLSSPPEVSTTMEMLRIESSAKFILRGGVGHNSNCQAVNWFPTSGLAKTTKPYNASSYFVSYFDFSWPPILMLDVLVTCPVAAVPGPPAPAAVNVVSFAAASVEELVDRLAAAAGYDSLEISLVPGTWYNFTQTAQSLYVPDQVQASVDCGGATLKDCSACDPQRPFIELNDGAQLTLRNCVLITSNLVLDTIDATSITWAPSMDINSSLTVIGGAAEEQDCQVVEWMSRHLGTVNGLTISTTQPMNASYIFIDDLRTDPTSPAGWPNVTVQNVAFMCCPPSMASDPLLEGWRLAALLLGLLVFALAVAVLLAYRFGFVRRGGLTKGAGLSGSEGGVVVAFSRGGRTPSRAGEVNADTIITTAVAEMRENLKAEHLQVHDVIGRGGHGTVYRGTWRGLAVAVKIVVFQGINPSDTVMQVAAAEASIAYNLSHPNIVATYSHELKPIYGEEVGTLLCWRLSLVQELCNGGTLTELLEGGALRDLAGGVALDRVLTVLLDVAAALAHLHSRRIAHGDLTPNNVLLRISDKSLAATEDCDARTRIALAIDSGDCVAKVTDFGMSMRIDPAVSHASGIFHGTPFYCAPELLQEHRLQEASDVFSYGVIMWQCATSCTPYISVSGILRRHPRFPYFPPGVPDAFALLALACMAVNPRERPSFTAVSDVLLALRRGLLSEHRQPSLPSVLMPHAPLMQGPPPHGQVDVSSRTIDRLRSSRHVSFTDGVDADLDAPLSSSDVWGGDTALDSCFLAPWRPQADCPFPSPPGTAGAGSLIGAAAAAAAAAPLDDWALGSKGTELSAQCRDLRVALEDVLSSMLDTPIEEQGRGGGLLARRSAAVAPRSASENAVPSPLGGGGADSSFVTASSGDEGAGGARRLRRGGGEERGRGRVRNWPWRRSRSSGQDALTRTRPERAHKSEDGCKAAPACEAATLDAAGGGDSSVCCGVAARWRECVASPSPSSRMASGYCPSTPQSLPGDDAGRAL